MPDTKDLLEQWRELPPERRVELAIRLFETYPGFYPPHFPSVVHTPDVCGGSARLVRTRIPIWVLQRMRQLEFTEEKIMECYPNLAASDLVEAWGYVARHSVEIEKEIEENERD